ncbi:hypothetical protein PR048_009748 [Dryococelus australis]|uniref:Uncharacterized protein n=1 Tax=Dryococelus australis TaxID=614101 RepID=A0ABQ9I0R0_9NEOP|nr:hypothetical protein PR048_009748 [Dryococelus australis]
MVNHPHKKLSPDEISGPFNIAFMKVATIEKAVNRFRKTGIFPIDPNTFAEEELLPCGLQEDITKQGMENVTPATSPIMPSSTTGNISVLPHMFLIPSGCAVPSCYYQDVSPVPKINSPTTIVSKTRRGRKMHFQVLTSNPQKKYLEDAKQKKADTQKKKEERGRQENA